MAEADPLWRVQQAARRASGPVAVPEQQRWYREQLDRDLAMNAGVLEERERAARAPRFTLAKLIAWLMLVIILAAALLTGMLWRDGSLGQLVQSAIPTEKLPDKDWIKAAGSSTLVEDANDQHSRDSSDSASVLPSPVRPKSVQDADADEDADTDPAGN
jgi:cytoskeletal protein RodZ